MMRPPVRKFGLPVRPRRTPRGWCSGSVEVLEGRALMAASPIDPGFHGGQPYVLEGSDRATLNSASAVAVSPVDGGIVVAGSILTGGGPNAIAGVGLAVRALTPAGLPRADFGANGQATIALPAGAYNRVTAASDVLIQPDGKIIVAADLAQADPSVSNPRILVTTPVETVVARLNADGTPDTSFGTNGLTVIAANTAQLSNLALQADGGIVLGGSAGVGGGAVGAVTRLKGDGSVDALFNGGNLLTIPGPFSFVGDVAISDTGLIYVTANSGGRYLIRRLSPDGSVDASFGTAGFVPTTMASVSLATVVQPDGKLVVAGGSRSDANKLSLFRLDVSGSVDPTFAVQTIPISVSSIALADDGKIVVGLEGLGAARYNADGTPDGTFAPGAVASFYVAPPASAYSSYSPNPTASGLSDGVAVLPGGRVVLAATATYNYYAPGSFGGNIFATSELIVAAFRPRVATAGDYDGDFKTDVAAQLAGLGYFAVRKSTGGDVLFPFGATTVGATIPVEADYDGDGYPDVAAYLPDLGTFVYAPSSAPGTQVPVPFGSAGAGASIPAVGDYDGDGRADVAVYLPAAGAFAVRPSGGGNYLAPFGAAGAGQSIPAPGDYDGDGTTDLAVYLPALGQLAYRPSTGGDDVFVPFGSAGEGASIPVPGDYDGDGRTDVAVYLPQFAALAIRPSRGGPNTLVPFGTPGAGRSIPAPGDYDGDGKADVAAYLPDLGIFAYRPSAGGPDVLQSFGVGGTGQTVPASSIPAAQPPSVAAAGVAGPGGAAGVWIPLVDDLGIDAAGKPRKPRA